MTALMHASYMGNVRMVKWLIQNVNCDVNKVNMNGVTALMFASYQGHT